MQTLLDSPALLYALPAAGLAGLYLLRTRLFGPGNRKLPPGPTGIPLFGCLQVLDQTQLPLKLMALQEQYGDIFSFYMGTQLVVVVASYPLMKEMLDDPVFAGRTNAPAFRRLTQNCGIAFTDGPVWSHHRRTSVRILRDFGFARVQSVEMVDYALDCTLHVLDSACDAKAPIEVLDPLLAASNSVIAQFTFGHRFDSDDKEFHDFTEAMKALFAGEAVAMVIKYPWIDYLLRYLPLPEKLTKIVEIAHGFISKEIKLREVAMSEEGAEPSCLCDVYIDERRKAEAQGDFETYKEYQLLRVCLEFFSAGTDTTARTLEWNLLYMAFHPDVQKRVHEELDKVVGQSRRPRMSDRMELNYVSAVLDEGFRRASLAAISVHHRAMQDAEFHGYTIPKNALILPFLYGVHHDARTWNQPEKFEPERFLDDSGRHKSSAQNIPFGIGRRSCVGESLGRMEVFLMFTALMQRYAVAPAAEFADKKEEILRGYMGLSRNPGRYTLVLSRR